MSKRLDSFNFKVDPGFKMYFQSCLNLCEYETVVGDCINTRRRLYILILIYIKLLNSIVTHKHRSQEKLSIDFFDYL